MKTEGKTLFGMKIVRKERIDRIPLLELPYSPYRQLSSILQLPSSEALWASLMKRIHLAKNQPISNILKIDKETSVISLADRLNQLALFQLLIIFWKVLGGSYPPYPIQNNLTFSLEVQSGQLQLTVWGNKNIDQKGCCHQLWNFIKGNMDKEGFVFTEDQFLNQCVSPLTELQSGHWKWPSIAVFKPKQNKSCLYFTPLIQKGLPLPNYLKVKSYLQWGFEEKQAFTIQLAQKTAELIKENTDNFKYYLVLTPETIFIRQGKAGKIKVDISIAPISMPFWKKDQIPLSFSECIYSGKQVFKQYTKYDLWSMALILLESSLSYPEHFRSALSSTKSSKQVIQLVKLTLIRLKEERQSLPESLQQTILQWLGVNQVKKKTGIIFEKQENNQEMKSKQSKIDKIMELRTKDLQNYPGNVSKPFSSSKQ